MPKGIEIAPTKVYGATLDDYVKDAVLTKTFGDIIAMRETASNNRSVFLAHTVFDACIGPDIGLIAEMIKRIDGANPNTDDVDMSSRMYADALEDVLDYETAERLITTADGTKTFRDMNFVIKPEDPVIIALAKATVYVAVMPARNATARKDRQRAVQMILDRIGGQKTRPERMQETVEYVTPDWLGLPKGKEDE